MAEDKARLCCTPIQISSKSRAFKERYMSRLLPAVKLIQERRREAAPAERLRAIRCAADMSLAMTAAASSLQGGRLWSRALLRDLSCHRHHPCRPPGPSVPRSSRRARLIKSRISRRLTYLAALKRSQRAAPRRRIITRPSDHGDCPIADYAGSDHGDRSISYYACSGGTHGRCLISDYAGSGHGDSPLSDNAGCPILQAQIHSLRQLVPGGSSMDVSSLLTEAADYIASLQLQVEAMASLAHCVSLSSLPQ